VSVSILKRAPMGALVEVEWEDANAFVGWAHREEPELAPCRSAGYLVARSETAVLIAGSVCSDGQSTNCIALPLGWITSARRLK
jgi:hypothetical protein